MSNENENENVSLSDLMESNISALDTHRPQPEDGWYEAEVVKIDQPKIVVVKKQGPNFGKTLYILDVSFRLTDWLSDFDGELPLIKGGIMLDIDSNGKLDSRSGYNSTLGSFREACGKNSERYSIQDCFGCALRVRVKNKDENSNIVSYQSL